MNKKINIILIILLILLIITSIGVGIYYIYNKYKKQDPFELEWVRIYYDYMKKNNEELKKQQKTLKYYRENEKIQFCEIENIKNPIMLYNYEELGQDFTKVLYINDNNTVSQIESFKKDSDVEFLYDIEENKFDYYICEVNGNEEKYTKIFESIKANKVNENIESADQIQEINIDNAVTFRNDEKTSVTTVDGQTLELLKSEEKFIKTSIVEDNWNNINLNSYEDEIKREISIAVKGIIKDLSKEEKQTVSQKREEIENRKEEMKKAVEEIERVRKEEEERKKAEEEARKKAEEEAKKAEEEARKKAEEEAKRLEEEQRNREETQSRNLYIEIWNI